MNNIEGLNNIERTLLGIGKCNYRHTQCQHIQNEIIRYNSKGIGFSNEFLLKYIDYLKYNDRWYGSYCCLSSGYFCKALNFLFEYLNPTKEILLVLCKFSKSYNVFLNLFDKNKIKSDSNYLLTAVLNEKRKNLSSLINLFCLRLDGSYQNLLDCCKLNNFSCANMLINNKNIVPKYECLLEACENSNNIELIKLLLKYIKPNKDCLVNACRKKNKTIIKLLIDYRILPDKTCFLNIFSGDRSYSIYYQEIIDIFIEYGYIPDLDDTILLLKYRCKIKDIYRFKIELGSKLLENCYKYDFFPYNINVPPTVECLQEECFKVGNISSIRNIVNKGVKPNITCLRNACTNKTNISVVKYLISLGIKPDLYCLKNSIYYFSQNQTIEYINDLLIKEFEKNNKTVSTQTEKNYKLSNSKVIIPTKYKIDLSLKNDNLENKNNENNSKKDKKDNISLTKIKIKNIILDKKLKKICSNDVYELLNIKNKKKISFYDIRDNLINYLTKNKLKNNKNKFLFKIDNNLLNILKIKKKKIYIFILVI